MALLETDNQQRSNEPADGFHHTTALLAPLFSAPLATRRPTYHTLAAIPMK